MDQSRNVLGNRVRGGDSAPQAATSGATVEVRENSNLMRTGVSQDRALLGRRRLPDPGTPLPQPLLDMGLEPAFCLPGAGRAEPGTASLLTGLERFGALIRGLALLVACAVIMLLAAQSASLFRELSYLPRPFALLGFAVVILLWLAVVLTAGRALMSLFRLRRSPAISLAALQQIEQRTTTLSQLATAEVAIREFLATYFERHAQEDLLREFGCADDASEKSKLPSICELKWSRERLLGQRYGTTAHWLEQVNREFVERLDVVANKRICDTYLRVGAATAMAPWGVCDGLIVLAHSWELVRDLCRLYGLRPSSTELALLGCHALFHTLLATGTGEALSEMEGDLKTELASRGIADAVLRRFSRRVAEGAVNALFTRRFGRRVKAMVRPIREG